ncbi:MAG: WD40/YVTN/BNR-like repeat-containing protein [Candidatus Zixiibacteriota bacterium]
MIKRYCTLLLGLPFVLSCGTRLVAQDLWTPIGPEGGWVDCIVFHPANPDTMYTGGDFFGGLYRSVDGGETWSRVESFGYENVWTILIDPSPPYAIYVGNMFEDSLGIRKSNDGGNSWTTILKYPDVASIAFDPTNSATIYAAGGFWENYQEYVHGAGVWKSYDGGNSWSDIGAGVIDTLNVQSVVVFPSNPQAVLVGTYHFPIPGPKGLYASLDGGLTWSPAGLQDKDVWKLAIAPTADSIVFAACWDSLYRSLDYGATWSAMSINATFFFDVRFAPSDNNIVYASAIPEGIFRSADGGETWTEVNNGLPATRVWVVAIHPTDPNTVFSGQQGRGIWKSTDGGNSWRDVNRGFRCTYPFDIVVGANSRLLAVFYEELGNHAAGVRVWDSLSGWSDLGMTGEQPIKTVAIDPSSSAVLYISELLELLTPLQHYRSDDTGNSWTPIGAGLPPDVYLEEILVHPDSPSVVYGATSYEYGYTGGRGLYKSYDFGQNWQFLGLDSMLITCLMFHPDSSAVLFAASLNTVYKSSDGGMSWDSLGISSIPILSLAVDHSNPKRLYAGSFGAGILRSSDGGISWQQTGLEAMPPVISIVIDPDFPNILYAGGSDVFAPGLGIYRSIDGGDSWQEFTTGLVNREIVKLAVDPSTRSIYAATTGYGVYRRHLPTDGCCDGMRGNVDSSPDGSVDIVDLSFLVEFLFGNSSAFSPLCPEESDIDGTGQTDIVDLTNLVDYLFGNAGSPAPAPCP